MRPAGRPSTSTTAAPDFSSAPTARLTGSPEPTMGSGADMCPWIGSWGRARPETSASSRSLSTTEPITSAAITGGSEEHTSELQSRRDLVCRLLLEKKKKKKPTKTKTTKIKKKTHRK